MALENCDRLALEFQPDSLAIGLFQEFDLLKYLINKGNVESESDKSFNDYVEKKLTPQQIDSLQKAMKWLTGTDKINYKKIIARKRLGYSELASKESMPVFMDAWLYNVARRQGKKISGLERLASQLEQVEEMRKKNLAPDILLSPVGTELFMEALTTVYLSEDIQRMYDKLFATESAYERGLFIGRNLQMLTSIESLIGTDKLFIAVGAGHLAGDSGLVWLLRGKGYTVEPVYTQNRKPASKYQYKSVLPARYNFKDTINGYGLRFPNEPALVEMVAGLKMQIYVDIGTGMGYFSASGRVPTILKESDSSGIMKYLLNRLEDLGEVKNSKPLRHNNVLGVEADIMKLGMSESYRLRIFYTHQVVYVLILWAEDKKMLTQADAKEFFASLVFEAPHLPKDEAWERYTNNEFAFSLLMPGKPKISDIGQKGNYQEVDALSMGMAMELSKANYYMFTCTKLRQGYYYPNDSTIFNETQLNLCSSLKAVVVKTTDTLLQGYHAQRLDLKISKGEGLGTVSLLMVNRSSILYVFIALNENQATKEESFETFLNSVAFTPYATEGWAYFQQDSLGIAGWLPGPFMIADPQADDVAQYDESFKVYKVYDKASGHSFAIYQETLSPYFWVDSDSTLWNSFNNTAYIYGDSVLSEKNVVNGNAKGKEWLTIKKGASSVTKRRIIWCGNKKYELVVNMHLADTASANANKLFNEFKILLPVDTAFVYTNKAKQILMDLRATDSATKQNAKAYLPLASFSKADLPLLYDALLYDYGEKDVAYNSIAHYLANSINYWQDDTVRLFAERNYEKVAKITGLQYQLLGMILESRTQEAADVCKQLLLTHTPTSDGSNPILECLYDSAQLLQSWYPEILQLANVASFKPALWRITEYMLDSNMIPVSMVLPYAETFYVQAKAELDSIKANNAEYDQYNMSSLLAVLAHCNTRKGNELLRTNLGLLFVYVKKDVIVALARNGIRAPDRDILAVAVEDGWRYLLYDDLAKYNKTAWFPAKYATQQQMAQSYIYNMLQDEDAEGTIIYVGEKTALYDGKQQRFYLFKVNYSEDGEDETLSICGPYSMDKKKLGSSYKAVAFSEEPYQKSEIQKQFRALLYNE